jgi:hypothetical protein
MSRGGHAGFGKAEERASGDEDVSNQDGGKGELVPRPDPQPKMQTGGEVAPNEKNEEYLAVPGPGINLQISNFVGIVDVDSRKDARPARIYDVDEQEIWNG